MASIGPQLPPHLQKRKRTPEDDAGQSAPRTKATRRANDDEIALDSDSDSDGYGPSAPAPRAGPSPAPTSKPTIGPSLPPSVSSAPTRPSQPIGPARPPPSANNNDEIDLSDSDSDTGPLPPPTAPPRRVLGPAPPPAALSQRPTTSPDSDSDSSDDGYGPALPFASGPAAAPQAPHRRPAASPPSAPKRDDWMLAPPSASSGALAPDPTKLKARKFASSRSEKPPPGSSGVSSIWTETPEEKARRLANAVLGREDPTAATPTVGAQGQQAGGMVAFRRTAADEDKIRAFTEQTRGRSLVEEHRAAKEAGREKGEGGGGGRKKDDDDDDDPSKRAFDWEKDMKVGGQISNSQRQQLLNRAANFGGRFQKGSFL